MYWDCFGKPWTMFVFPMTKDWIIAPRGRTSKGAGSSAIVRVGVLWVGFGLMGKEELMAENAGWIWERS